MMIPEQKPYPSFSKAMTVAEATAIADEWRNNQLRYNSFISPLTAIEDYIVHCGQMQGRCHDIPVLSKQWEVRILSCLVAIEILYGLEETYDLHP